jgi:hypothetical protein
LQRVPGRTKRERERETRAASGLYYITAGKRCQYKGDKNMMNINKIREAIEAKPARSAWSRGVKLYAYDLIDGLDEAITGGYFDEDDLASPKLVSRAMLDGADSWNQYSWGRLRPVL